MLKEQFSTLTEVGIYNLRIGDIVFDKDGQLYMIYEISLTIPTFDSWSGKLNNDNDSVLVINPVGKIRAITNWLHYSGKTGFDEYLFLNQRSSNVTIQILMDNLLKLKLHK